VEVASLCWLFVVGIVQLRLDLVVLALLLLGLLLSHMHVLARYVVGSCYRSY
jgi:hypothetical protein